MFWQEKVAGYNESQMTRYCEKTHEALNSLTKPIPDKAFDSVMLDQWERIANALADKLLTLCNSYYVTRPDFAHTVMRLYNVPSFRDYIDQSIPNVKFALLTHIGIEVAREQGLPLQLVQGTNYDPLADYDLDAFNALLKRLNEEMDSVEKNRHPFNADLLAEAQKIAAAAADYLDTIGSSEILKDYDFLKTLRAMYDVPEFQRYVAANATQATYLILMAIGETENRRRSSSSSSDPSPTSSSQNAASAIMSPIKTGPSTQSQRLGSSSSTGFLTPQRQPFGLRTTRTEFAQLNHRLDEITEMLQAIMARLPSPGLDR